jgi:phosphate transport system substrate-binding protein
MISQSGDLGIAGYVSQNFAEGAIGYVNDSYSLGTQFPVAKVLNAAGYYTEPTPQNVAVSLLKARINFDESSQDYLTQILDDVYTDGDNRNYQLSSYSYFILPTKVQGQFNTEKGKTLGAFTYYAMCQAQQQSASLGYSPLPVNLVRASLDQIKKIPGVVVQDIDISKCKNPTFSPDGTNLLADTAPQPQACDKQGPNQCGNGTGGTKASTPVKASASGGTSRGTTAGTTGAGSSAAGAGGAGSNSSSGSTAAQGGTGGAATLSCDPLLGSCSSGDSTELAAAPNSGAGAGNQVTTVLTGSRGWGTSQSLIVVVCLLTLALLILPPVAWRRFAGTKE